VAKRPLSQVSIPQDTKNAFFFKGMETTCWRREKKRAFFVTFLTEKNPAEE